MTFYRLNKTYLNVQPNIHVTVLGQVAKQATSNSFVFASIEIDGTIYPAMFSTMGHLSAAECHSVVIKRCADINLNNLENVLKPFDVTPVVGNSYQYGDHAVATILSYIVSEGRYLGVVLSKDGKSKPMYFTDNGRSIDYPTRDLQRTAHAGSPLVKGLRDRNSVEAQAALQALFANMGMVEARGLYNAINRL